MFQTLLFPIGRKQKKIKFSKRRVLNQKKNWNSGGVPNLSLLHPGAIPPSA
jgi:hypothetical protein